MSATCLHCQSAIQDAHAPAGYCCVGCATVASLLKTQGLTRFYDLQNSAVGPVQLAGRAADLAWLEQPLADARACAVNGTVRLEMDVQGIRCSACVWLLRELFTRLPGAGDAVVNPSVGRVLLSFREDTDVAAYVRSLESFGYRAGPPSKEGSTSSDGVLLRLGLCVALTMNSMMFSFAHYLGLTPSEPELFSMMRWLNLGFSVAVLWIGGSEFFSRAWFALRQRIIPFDLPIALGLALAFAGSLLVFFRRPDTFSYFDTLNTFTTLMLVGRWLQQRLLDRNRRALLNHDGLEGLYARRVAEGRVETVHAHAVRSGDVVLVPPGGLLVVDATLVDDTASCSLDWVNGESSPRGFSSGQRVPAGAFNAGQAALRFKAAVDFRDSTLVPLLARDVDATHPTEDDPIMLRRLTRIYIPFVLTSAAAAFALWFKTDVDKAIMVTTSVLVVTCPCALGLAIPLAYQRINAALRQRGLFVRRGSFLDRAVNVTDVVFDKTGTLTLGHLTLSNPEVFHTLSPTLAQALYNMTARSTHPASRCVHAAIPSQHAVFNDALAVSETPGQGLSATLPDGTLLRLGSTRFAAPDHASADDTHDVWFSANGAVQACFALREALRWDARAELATLRAEGFNIHILSGDAPQRVATAAQQLGLQPGQAVGGLSPQGKADWLRTHGGAQHAILVGDGVNDHPGFDVALCSGTPAVEHPALSSRADFYFLTAGVGCVRTALHAARQLRRTVTNVRAIALTYNVLSVAACLAGWVSPVLAAIAMPSSSILILLYTVRSSTFQEASQPSIPAGIPAGSPAAVSS